MSRNRWLDYVMQCYWFDFSEGPFFYLFRVVEVPPLLDVQPKIRSRPQKLSEAQCGTRGDAPTSIDQFVHTLIGNPNSVRNISLR